MPSFDNRRDAFSIQSKRAMGGRAVGRLFIHSYSTRRAVFAATVAIDRLIGARGNAIIEHGSRRAIDAFDRRVRLDGSEQTHETPLNGLYRFLNLLFSILFDSLLLNEWTERRETRWEVLLFLIRGAFI